MLFAHLQAWEQRRYEQAMWVSTDYEALMTSCVLCVAAGVGAAAVRAGDVGEH